MSIRKEKHPSPPPLPAPPAKYNDPGVRRYRVEIIQRQYVDVDVTAGPSPDDQDEQTVRFIAARLMNAVRSNPNDPSAWQSSSARTFPEPVGETKWELGDVIDVGPGVQMSPNQREVIRALQDAGKELPAVVPEKLGQGWALAQKRANAITVTGIEPCPGPPEGDYETVVDGGGRFIRHIELPPAPKVIDVQIVKVKPPEASDETDQNQGNDGSSARDS